MPGTDTGGPVSPRTRIARSPTGPRAEAVIAPPSGALVLRSDGIGSVCTAIVLTIGGTTDVCRTTCGSMRTVPDPVMAATGGASPKGSVPAITVVDASSRKVPPNMSIAGEGDMPNQPAPPRTVPPAICTVPDTRIAGREMRRVQVCPLASCPEMFASSMTTLEEPTVQLIHDPRRSITWAELPMLMLYGKSPPQ